MHNIPILCCSNTITTKTDNQNMQRWKCRRTNNTWQRYVTTRLYEVKIEMYNFTLPLTNYRSTDNNCY